MEKKYNVNYKPSNNMAEKILSGKISDIVITEGVISIPPYRFHESDLSKIILPTTLQTIEKNAFRGCEKLTSIIIPEGVTKIAEYCFYECANLLNVELPGTLTTIGDFVFAGCSDLEFIKFNSTIEKWNAVRKSSLWSSSSAITFIQCLDGQVSL